LEAVLQDTASAAAQAAIAKNLIAFIVFSFICL
jgi:hypothetical protein